MVARESGSQSGWWSPQIGWPRISASGAVGSMALSVWFHSFSGLEAETN